MKRNRIIVKILQLLNPNYGRCCKCRLPWNHCTERTIYYKTTESFRCGFFAVCDHCWNNSTLNELIKYHINVYYKVERDFPIKTLISVVTYEFYKNKAGI